MRHVSTLLLVLGLTLLLILLSYLFSGSILLLWTTFTLDYFIQSLVWFVAMWYVAGLIEKYMKQLREWRNERH